MNLIEINNLVKHYGRISALREATFQVSEGITGLIGPNGAGKSTLIKILLGLIHADSGKATVFGLDSQTDRSKILEKVGVLHEKPRFPSWATGREYLEYAAKLKGNSRVTQKIERVCEMFGLGEFIDRKIGTFSAGMAQRLGLADALIGNPDLVILDEPTANLDPLGRLNVLTSIRRLRDEEGVNFIISTHILSELERVCDNVVIINEGIILTHGSLRELVPEYTNPKYLVKVDNIRKFIKRVSKKNVANLEVRDDSIFLDVKDRDSFIMEINNLVKGQMIVLLELKPLSPTLEDVFVEVLRRRKS
jgi:ABC-2 type transport system ATP-binding protein